MATTSPDRARSAGARLLVAGALGAAAVAAGRAPAYAVDRPSDDVRRRVVVVGAGLAGLSCALTLVDHGWTVDLVEARERVGGRVHTLVDPFGPRHARRAGRGARRPGPPPAAAPAGPVRAHDRGPRQVPAARPVLGRPARRLRQAGRAAQRRPVPGHPARRRRERAAGRAGRRREPGAVQGCGAARLHLAGAVGGRPGPVAAGPPGLGGRLDRQRLRHRGARHVAAVLRASRRTSAATATPSSRRCACAAGTGCSPRPSRRTWSAPDPYGCGWVRRCGRCACGRAWRACARTPRSTSARTSW